ncbi:unnamed protein product, partial [Mycena citricolor]
GRYDLRARSVAIYEPKALQLNSRYTRRFDFRCVGLASNSCRAYFVSTQDTASTHPRSGCFRPRCIGSLPEASDVKSFPRAAGTPHPVSWTIRPGTLRALLWHRWVILYAGSSTNRAGRRIHCALVECPMPGVIVVRSR